MMSHPVVLLGDIGGTNARFALFSEEDGLGEAMALPCSEFSGPAQAAAAFLERIGPDARPVRGIFSLACPVAGDLVRLTNLDWEFSLQAIGKALDLDRLDAVNDFVAQAMAVPRLAAGDLEKIGMGDVAKGSPLAVIGPGTGLGVASLAPTEAGWLPLAGEGGHVTMAAKTRREAAVLEILGAEFGHVSAERLLSGPGLVNIYRALCRIEGEKAAGRDAAGITETGLKGSDALAVETMEIFAAMLGTVAGNLALTIGAKGGIYLAGGILPRILPWFRQSVFRSSFEDKGRFRDYLARIPTFVVTKEHSGLLGLAALAGFPPDRAA